MANVSIPHFDLPFRFGTYGTNAAVVQQDSTTDVRNCVEAILRTQSGSRLYVPAFGVDDPSFSAPVDPSNLHQQIVANELRAEMYIGTTESESPWILDLIVEVRANV